MVRRKQIPWIHRWSRPIMAGIAAVGALGTGYLTIIKLLGASAACPTEGCDQVLNSPYATVFGLPLTLFGFLAYASMGVAAIAPLVINPEKNRELRTKIENWTWLYLFMGGSAMAIFSAYLMYVLAFQLKQVCVYCIVSACLSLSLFLLSILGRTWEDVGQLLFTGVIVAVLTLTGTLAVYANVNGPRQTAMTPGFEVTTTSGPAEIALAQHLKSVGARMYGAYWCPHCLDQKQLFGKQAATIFEYIECASDAPNSQESVCRAIAPEVREATGREFGFPTWEINGQFLVGTQSLNQLADATNYTGPRNFQNSP